MAPLLEMRGISKTFPGVRALERRLARRSGRRSALPARPERRRQVHAHPDPVRRASSGCGRNPRRRRARAPAIAGRRPPPGHRRHLPGVLARSVSRRRAEHLSRARAARPAARHRRSPADARRGAAAARRARPRPRHAHARAHELGVAQQQVVEIAKALSQNARILVMDEPTAALSDREIERLFDRVRALKATGVAVIYISHRLQEIAAIGDRVTVLRDGRNVASLAPADGDGGRARASDGRTRRSRRRIASRFCEQPGEVVLAVDDLSSENGVRGGDAVACAPAKWWAWPAWSGPAGPSSRARSSAPTGSFAAPSARRQAAARRTRGSRAGRRRPRSGKPQGRRPRPDAIGAGQRARGRPAHAVSSRAGIGRRGRLAPPPT